MTNKFTLSIDWEDFGQLLCKYHHNILTTPLNSIARQTDIILDMLDETNTKVTFFVLGMLAQYRSDLVKKIHSKGHEIALHGQNHIAMFTLSRKEAEKDIRDSFKLITDIIGKPIYGYRAPLFSINETSLFVLEILSDLGIEYDSSIFPVKMPRYGINGFSTKDQLYELPNKKKIVELPLTVLECSKKKWPVSGGGYIRLMPFWLVKKVFKTLSKSDASAMIYMHPYEFDTQKLDTTSNYPKDVNHSKAKAFLLNLRWNAFRDSIREKIMYLLLEYDFITCKEKADYVKNNSINTAILG